MKTFNKKKGFTIVELVIVVAVIGVLTAVLVPTFVNLVNKANQAADESLVKNLNTQLRMKEATEGKNKTMQDALNDALEGGYKVENLTPTSTGKDIIWSSIEDKFFFVDADRVPENGQSTNLYDYFKVYNSMPETQTFSIYAKGTDWASAITGLQVGFDAGINTGIATIDYAGTVSKNIVIRTNGGTLTIGAQGNVALGQIYHHGALKSSVVYAEENCFHTYGAIGEMNLKAGKLIAEESSLVYLCTANLGVKVAEKDTGKIFIPETVTQKEDGTGVPVSVAEQINITPVEANPDYTYEDATKAGGNVYEIANLHGLEQFRDLVNTGFNFDGISVKLTSDITLKDGWTPIGEGSRKAAINTQYGSEGWKYSGNVYKGEFDGNGHKIYNLNNKGYVPTPSSLGNDGSSSIYCYGLFSIVAGHAYIHDLELVDVDIDTSRYQSVGDNVKGDSVGALVGFSAGALTIDKVIVSGNSSVIAYAAVGSILGKSYNQDKDFLGDNDRPTITLTNCRSNANVLVLHEHYATGMFGAISNGADQFDSVTIENNTFTGVVSTNPANKRVPQMNNAGIAILSVNNDPAFTHSGNVNTGTQIGGNGSTIENCLFVVMSSSTAIESPRNTD